MRWMRMVRALGTSLGGKQAAPTATPAEQQGRTFFVGIDGRPMCLTVSALTPDAVVDSIEAAELPLRKASGALQLRGLARVDGQLVTLHDVDPLRSPKGRPAAQAPVQS
jgi:hypothetical protein